MVAAGLLGIAVASAFAAWWSMRRTLRVGLDLAIAVVGVTAVAAFALALLLGGPALGFGIPTAALALGFAAALAGGGGRPAAWSDDDPPWWPRFERDLRRYERTRRTPSR